MKISKKFAAIGLAATLVLGITACGGQNTDAPSTSGPLSSAPATKGTVDKELSGKLVIEGSTSVAKIFQELIDTYMAKNPKVKIEYIGDGSSAGIKAAIADTANIGTASRAVKDEEKNQGLEVFQMADDAIAIIVNPANKVQDLTKEQIAKIYKKEITNWQDAGGDDAPIVVVARDAASGTREAFETIFEVADQVKADQEAAKTGEVKTVVAQNPNAIGYISLAYSDNTVKNVTVEGLIATIENVKNGIYTIKRPFNMVTKGKPDELEQAFIDFVFSEEGAEIIAKEAVPVKK
ncbi:MAG TPA: phosphate ABC transporter phosphate-binding protein [Ruminiclostridium sp.]|nr:phosphate ABC transporter phosphate-binding protein [Ruminiclostridium sp.]